jgi:hypothetical protein
LFRFQENKKDEMFGVFTQQCQNALQKFWRAIWFEVELIKSSFVVSIVFSN